MSDWGSSSACRAFPASQASGIASRLHRGGPAEGGPTEELSPSIPTRISIPSLGVRAKVIEVGQAADGSIATPATDPAEATGWYRLGPTPGELGTAVIVGHVDTDSQPAVFHRLPELRKGELIEVNREDQGSPRSRWSPWRPSRRRHSPRTGYSS